MGQMMGSCIRLWGLMSKGLLVWVEVVDITLSDANPNQSTMLAQQPPPPPTPLPSLKLYSCSSIHFPHSEKQTHKNTPTPAPTPHNTHTPSHPTPPPSHPDTHFFVFPTHLYPPTPPSQPVSQDWGRRWVTMPCFFMWQSRLVFCTKAAWQSWQR